MKRLNAYATSMLILFACTTNLPAQVISTDESEPPRLTEDSPTESLPSVAKEAEPPTAYAETGLDESVPQNPLAATNTVTAAEAADEPPVPPGLPASSESTGPTYIMGTNVIVAYSDDKDTIWGFSKVTGKWAKQTINPVPSGKLVPVVAAEVAALQVSEAIYAFSGRRGTWDLLRLPKGRKARIGFDDDVILVTDGENVYTFPATTGRWSSPSSALGTDLEKATVDRLNPSGSVMDKVKSFGTLQQMVRDPAAEQQIKVFSLMNINVESAAALIRQLFDADEVLVAAEVRSNSLIASGTKETLAKVEALLLRLDENGNAPKKESRSSKSGNPYGAGGAGMVEMESMYSGNLYGSGVADLESFEQLLEKFQSLNLDTATIASRYRQLRESGKAGSVELQDLKGQLHEGVSAAFGVRQRLQQVELAELRRELHSIQQTINARELMKEKIIERRVSDLLNPQLRWNADTKKAASPNQTADAPASNPFQADPYAQDPVEDSPLAARRRELEDRRQRLFEDIVGIELSLIESNNSSTSGYIKRLSAEDLKRLSDEERNRFEVETNNTENRILQFEDRKSSLESEFKLVEQQLDHIDSRLRESPLENAPMIDSDDNPGRSEPPPTHVVFYHADWCLTCEAIKPEIEKLESDGLPIVFRDLSANDPAAKLAGVNSVPAFDLWVDGQFKERVEGRDYGPLIEKLRTALAATKGTPRPETSLSPNEHSSDAVLSAKLAAAESQLKQVETLYRRGIYTETQFAKAKLEVEVLKQQIADSRSRRDAEEQLLVIDLKSAQLEFEAATEELAQMERFRRNTTSAASISELARLRLAMGKAELSVQRAQAKLDYLRSQANRISNGN